MWFSRRSRGVHGSPKVGPSGSAVPPFPVPPPGPGVQFVSKRRELMHGMRARASVCAAVVLLGLLVAGCEKDYRQIVVIDGDRAEFVTLGRVPRKQPKEIYAPGRTLVFRTTSSVPGIQRKAVGKAGHVYRVNDDLEMEEIGEFQLSMPNDTLAYQFGR